MSLVDEVGQLLQPVVGGQQPS